MTDWKVPSAVYTECSLNVDPPTPRTVFWYEHESRSQCLSVSSVADFYEQVVTGVTQTEMIREYVRRVRRNERKEFLFLPYTVVDHVHAYFQAGGRDVALVVVGSLQYLDETIAGEQVASLVVVRGSASQPEIAALCEKHCMMAYLEPPSCPSASLDEDLKRWGWNKTNNISIAWPRLKISGVFGEMVEISAAPVLTGHAQKDDGDLGRRTGRCVRPVVNRIDLPRAHLEALERNGAVSYLYHQSSVLPDLFIRYGGTLS